MNGMASTLWTKTCTILFCNNFVNFYTKIINDIIHGLMALSMEQNDIKVMHI